MPEEFLYMHMVESGMKINPGTLASLREAIEGGNVYFFEEDSEPLGFVTWFLDGDTLEIMNLCIFNGDNQIKKFFGLRKVLHERYPQINKIRWHDDKRQRIFKSHFGKELAYGKL